MSFLTEALEAPAPLSWLVARAGFEPAISASPGARRVPRSPSQGWLVAPAGFEPAISALRGLRPGPLDDGAVAKRRAVWELKGYRPPVRACRGHSDAGRVVGGAGIEPATSCV